MLRRVSEILGYVLEAEDGDIGRCDDFLFHDRLWAVRYMVAHTRKWLRGRKVLVAPAALDRPNWENRRLSVKLTRQQIKESPPLDEDAPISRQYEIKMLKHYGWLPRWPGEKLRHPIPDASGPHAGREGEQQPEAGSASGEYHLRSSKQIKDYGIQARDGEIGHVEDFILDDHDWLLRYLVVDTLNILPGRERQVLLAPDRVESIDAAEATLRVNLTVQAVKESPRYDPSVPLKREYERVLHDYYGWPKYWEQT